MDTITISDWQAVFEEDDGTLPDGVITDIDQEGRGKLFELITDEEWKHSVVLDDERIKSIEEDQLYGYEMAQQTLIKLFLMDNLQINIRFATPESIDFDFDRAQIEVQEDLDELLLFIELAGNALEREVKLAYEGGLADRDYFYIYDPVTRTHNLSKMVK